MNNKPTLLILAAGMGSRYGGLKQIEPIGPNGETIIEYSIFDAIRAGFGKVVFVIRKSFADQFKARFADKLDGKIEVEFVFQELDKLPAGYSLPEGREKPWGTGHAILMAKDVINEPFAAINADDFYGTEAFRVAAEFLTGQVSESQYAMVGYQLKNTLSEFGTVSRGICKTDEQGNLLEIVERTKIARENGTIYFTDEDGSKIALPDDSPASMNFWGFHPTLFGELERLFKLFLNEKMHEKKSEFYIPSVVFELIESGKAKAKVLSANSPWFGVTYPEDKPFVVEQVKKLAEKGDYPVKL
ncbi:MAG TPA: sugar phosphate nucleotidyltransferase [Sunxiuqinia sp.]|nr:sugar phosphate nucleotidyltransferase [Sunxiuqinia sp.]